jgi:hypothetical protein
MTNEPLIWTLYGNLPLASLKYEHEWIETDVDLMFQERWLTQEGELVKNNCHLYRKPKKSRKRRAKVGGDVTVALEGAGIGGQQAVMA